MQDQKEDNAPAPGQKRFELRRTAPLEAVWVDVEGRGTWFDPSGSGEERCVYVDLPAGSKVRIIHHVESLDPNEGTVIDLRISEYGAGQTAWYDTARVSCGRPGQPCAKPLLEEWLGKLRALPRGIADPCGSTKIAKPSWSTAPVEIMHPTAVTAELVLEIYRFEQRHPPGSPECRRAGAP